MTVCVIWRHSLEKNKLKDLTLPLPAIILLSQAAHYRQLLPLQRKVSRAHTAALLQDTFKRQLEDVGGLIKAQITFCIGNISLVSKATERSLRRPSTVSICPSTSTLCRTALQTGGVDFDKMFMFTWQGVSN